MHFGPSSGEPCPFRLEPINPATLGKTASWVWKRGCQQSRGRLCTGERGPLPCETRETGLKSRRGRQQSTAPQAFPEANGGRDSEQPGLSKRALAQPAAPTHWHGEGKGKGVAGEGREILWGWGGGCSHAVVPQEGAACDDALPDPPHLCPHTTVLFLCGMGTVPHCHSSCSSWPHSQGNIPPLSSGTSRDWAHGSANPTWLCSMVGAGHHGCRSGGRKSPAVGRWPPPVQPTPGDQYGQG